MTDKPVLIVWHGAPPTQTVTVIRNREEARAHGVTWPDHFDQAALVLPGPPAPLELTPRQEAAVHEMFDLLWDMRCGVGRNRTKERTPMQIVVEVDVKLMDRLSDRVSRIAELDAFNRLPSAIREDTAVCIRRVLKRALKECRFQDVPTANPMKAKLALVPSDRLLALVEALEAYEGDGQFKFNWQEDVLRE